VHRGRGTVERMVPSDWIEHRRDDGERLGWIRPDGELWVAVDLLGREVSAAVEWLEAEAALDADGLSPLAERWWLGDVPVRIAEVSTDRVVVVTDEFGAASAVGSTVVVHELPWPAPAELTRRG